MKTNSQRNRLSSQRSLFSRLFVERLEERTVLSSFVAGFGGAAGDAPTQSHAIDPNGNSYISGQFSSQPADFDPGPGVFNLSSAGGNDAFIAKYAPDGSLAWARSFGGTADDLAQRSIFADETTGDYVYVAGNFQSSSISFGPGITLINAGGNDVFLAKLDAQTGTTVWAKGLDGAGTDYASDLGFDNGKIHLAGLFQGTVDFDPGPGVATMTANPNDYQQLNGYLWTLDASGNYVSAWQLPTAMESILVEGDTVYVKGRFWQTVDFDPGPGVVSRTPVGTNNVYVAQYTTAGALNWVQTMPVGVANNLGSIASNSTSLYVPLTDYLSTHSDIFVASFNKATGALQWSKQFGGGGYDWCTTAVVNQATDMLYVASYFGSPSIDFNPGGSGGVVVNAGGSSGTNDGYVLKLSAATGSFQQVWRMGGAGNDTARVYDAVGTKVYASGYFEGTADFPTGGTLTSAGGQDGYLMALDESDLPPPPPPPPPPVTKFYVANDGSPDRTYEYAASGASVENYAISAGNTAPRGAASTAAGDKVWVVDANKKVYAYNTSGGLLGSWSAGSLPSNADVQGIATNGTDVWIVDNKGDKIYRYTGAATRLSGSQSAASSFNLNSSNTSPTDLVTDGTSIWVVNDSSTDKVFKYTVGGSLLGSWTINSGGGSPTGITLDPANVSNLWIVDNNTDRVYQFDAAASRTSGSQSPSTSFALAAGNTNPQAIADPPAPLAGGANLSLSGPSPDLPFDSALLGVVDELSDWLAASGRKRK